MTNSGVKKIAEQMGVSLPFDTHCVIGLTDSCIVYEWMINDIGKFRNEGKDFHGIAYSGITENTVDSYALLDKDLNILLFVYCYNATTESISSCLARCVGILGFNSDPRFEVTETVNTRYNPFVVRQRYETI